MSFLNLDENSTNNVEFDASDLIDVSGAGTALYAVAIITLLGAILLLFLGGLNNSELVLTTGLTLVAVVIFAAFGYFTKKLKLWALIGGIVLYLLDTGLTILQMVESKKFSAGLMIRFIVLFYLFRGLFALLRLKATEKAIMAQKK